MLLRGSIRVQSVHRFKGRVHPQLEPLNPIGRANGRGDLDGKTTGGFELVQGVDRGFGGLEGHAFLELPKLMWTDIVVGVSGGLFRGQGSMRD